MLYHIFQQGTLLLFDIIDLIAEIKTDTIIYDGVVLMKDESSMLEKLINKVFGYSKDGERVYGVQSMLPNYIEEVTTEVPLENLLTSMMAVRTRQLEHLSGFSTFCNYVTDQRSGAKELCDQVS